MILLKRRTDEHIPILLKLTWIANLERFVWSHLRVTVLISSIPTHLYQ